MKRTRELTLVEDINKTRNNANIVDVLSYIECNKSKEYLRIQESMIFVNLLMGRLLFRLKYAAFLV